MLGAIIGDMVGSIYEFEPIKSKEFNIFDIDMSMTDDSYLTIAVAETLMNNYPIKYDEKALKKIQEDLANAFIKTWYEHIGAGWGSRFFDWCKKSARLGKPAEAYNSCGNGSAMRISPVAWVANTLEEVKILSKTVTEITHNHPEGIKGAEAIAVATFMALHGATKEEIKEVMVKEYYPQIANFDFDDLVRNYEFSEICQKSTPEAIYCFLISDSLEDTIRNCVAIGGDCDTTGAMAGAIAEAFYNKDKISDFEDKFLYLLIDPSIEHFIKEFHGCIGSKKMYNTQTRK
jgi:type I restriction enzyme M protein